MNQEQPDPHAPETQPTRQGRRLIRMLFRSTAEDAKSSSINAAPEHDGRAEDAVAWKSSSNHQENGNKPAVVPAPTSKFASLKRKLFPSQNRRHPRHVPPLLISPINAPVKASPSVPPLEDSYRRSMTRICDEDDSDENQIAECSSKSICTESFKLKRPACESLECTPESNTSCAVEGDNNWRASGRRTLIDDDDDRDLESAVEALDLESSIADKTLDEMNKAISDLRAWKQIHEQETQAALSKMQDSEAQRDIAEPPIGDDHLEEQLELKRQQQQRDREALTLELRKEAEAYQLECSAFRTTLDESEASRVEQALQSSSDSEGLALSRLRNELFQLDVKQRQEALLQEIQGTNRELDMNIVDVQAFTGELDAILAQFDSSSVLESNDQVES